MRNKKVRFIISMLLLVSMLVGMGGLTAFAEGTQEEQKDPVEAVKEEIGKLPTAEEAAEMNDEQKTALNDTIKTITETLDDLLKENKISEEDRDEIGAPVYALAKALTDDTPDTNDNSNDENTYGGNTGDGNADGGSTDGDNTGDTDPAVEKVKADIDALPTADEIAEMDDAQKEALNNKLREISDDIEALLAEGKLTKDELNQLMQRVDAVGAALIGDTDTLNEKHDLYVEDIGGTYFLYSTTEDGEKIYLYCFNSDLAWPHDAGYDSTGKVSGKYVHDSLTYLEAAKEDLHRLFYAGYPHNNAGLYRVSEDGKWIPTVGELEKWIRPSDELLNIFKEAHPNFCDWNNTILDWHLGNVMFTLVPRTEGGGEDLVADHIEGKILSAMADDWILYGEPPAGVTLEEHFEYVLFIMGFNGPTSPKEFREAYGELAEYSSFYPEIYTPAFVHDATQEAVWYILYYRGINNNKEKAYNELRPLVKKLVDFALDRTQAVPPESVTSEVMQQYKTDFSAGNYLKFSDDKSVKERPIQFTKESDGRYYSEPIHFTGNVLTMPYHFEVKDGSGTSLFTTVNYGNGTIVLEADSRPTSATVTVNAEYETSSGLQLFVNEKQANVPFDQKTNETIELPGGVFQKKYFQDMGGSNYAKGTLTPLSFSATFIDPEPGKTMLAVQKEWIGDAPEGAEITVQLYKETLDADGKPVADSRVLVAGKTLTLNAADYWYGEFLHLDLPAENEHYVIDEVSIVKKTWNETTQNYNVVDITDQYKHTVSCSEATGSKVHAAVIVNERKPVEKVVSCTIPVKKSITGTNPTLSEFFFDLQCTGGTCWSDKDKTHEYGQHSAKILGAGSAEFPIIYFAVGSTDAEYKFTLKENDKIEPAIHAADYTKDKSEYEITVTVASNSEVTMTKKLVKNSEGETVTDAEAIAITGEIKPEFTNIYAPKRNASLVLSVDKFFHGLTAEDAAGKSVSFELYRAVDNTYNLSTATLIDTQTVSFGQPDSASSQNSLDKRIIFNPIMYSSTGNGVGVYYYILKENDCDWCKKDATEHKILVTVTNGVAGTFDIRAAADGKHIDLTQTADNVYHVDTDSEIKLGFTNTAFTAASYALPVKKLISNFTGTSSVAFSFSLVKNTTSPICYTKNEGGVLSEPVGTLKATITGAGNGTFPTIYFKTPGTYVFTLTEDTVPPDAAAYTKDTARYEITVTVAANAAGELSVTSKTMKKGTEEVKNITETDVPAFTNTFSNKASIKLPVYKSIANIKNSMAGEPTFNFALYLTGSDYKVTAATPVVSAKSIKIGTVDDTSYSTEFDVLYFTSVADGTAKRMGGAGTYYFVVKETGTVTGYTMDTAEHKIELTVTPNEESGIFNISAKLNNQPVTLDNTADGLYTINSTDATGIKFLNSYNSGATVSVTFYARKTLTGDQRPYGIRKGEFTFEAYDEAGNVVSTGATDAKGDIEFTPIVYKRADLGGAKSKEFVYSISEVRGKDRYITYSKQSFTVKVTLTARDDGGLSATVQYPGNTHPNFVNTFSKTPNPFTGDNANLALWGVLCGIAVLGIGGALFYVKKKGKKK